MRALPCHTIGRPSHPSREARPSEPPRPEEIESELTRSLLLGLWCVARAGDVARARLDARLRCVDRIETILELEIEIVLEVVRVHEAEPGAQAEKPLVADLLAYD